MKPKELKGDKYMKRIKLLSRVNWTQHSKTIEEIWRGNTFSSHNDMNA